MNPCDFYLSVFGLDLYLALDTNTIYYTLSTIAQTLAGALAVLVAIVLFNFDKVNNVIGNGVALDPDHKSAPSTKWRTRRSFVAGYGLSLLNVAVCFATLPLSPMLLDNC